MLQSVFRSWVIAFAFLILTPVIVLGQNTDAACRAYVNRAYSQLGQTCAGLGVNQACHGHGIVNASFYVDGTTSVPAEEFTDLHENGHQADLFHPAENAKLENFSGVSLVPPDNPSDDGEWGIGMIHTHGYLPQQLENNVVKMFLFGDAEIESAILPNEVFIRGDLVDVEVANASIFNEPPGYTFDGYESEVIDAVSGTFEADAISPDGAWVRVFYIHEGMFAQRSTAWLQVADLTNNPDLSDLPELGPEDFAPKQSFYLQGNSDGHACGDYAPPHGVLVQGPEGFETDLHVNEVPIRFNSSAYIHRNGSRSMRVSVLNGVAHLFPGTEREVIVAAGEEVDVCLTEDAEDLGIDGLADNQAHDPECGIGEPQVFSEDHTFFQNLPSNVLHYQIPRVTVIRASGIGSPVVSIIINPPGAEQRLRELCARGDFPARICEFLP